MILFNYVNIKENNIGGVRPIYDKLKCAEECLKTENCKAFTWASKLHHAKGCYLKTSQGFRNRFYLFKQTQQILLLRNPLKSTAAGIIGKQYELVSGIRCDGNTAIDVMPPNGYIYGNTTFYLINLF